MEGENVLSRLKEERQGIGRDGGRKCGMWAEGREGENVRRKEERRETVWKVG